MDPPRGDTSRNMLGAFDTARGDCGSGAAHAVRIARHRHGWPRTGPNRAASTWATGTGTSPRAVALN